MQHTSQSQPEARAQLDLRPLNANVRIVDPAYMALKGASVDADIYGTERRVVSTNVS